MNNKLFRAAVALCTVFMMSGTAAIAQENELVPYQEGLHYFEIEQASAVSGDTVEVVELFSYLCTHCNTFEPYINSLVKRIPDYVDFRRIPVVFGRGSWELYARGFITAELMNLPEEAHMGMMDRLWKEKKIMRSLDEIAEFYSQYGADKEKFLSTAQSFAVDGRMRKDQLDVRNYGITGTPALVVAGKYRIAGNAAVPSFEAMLDVVDFLVEKERAGMQQISATAD